MRAPHQETHQSTAPANAGGGDGNPIPPPPHRDSLPPECRNCLIPAVHRPASKHCRERLLQLFGSN